MDIQKIEQKHYSQLAEIYRQGIETGNATFETNVPDWESWDKTHLPECRIAAFEGETMTGWAALTPVSGRSVYAGVTEVSVYVADDFRGKGIGKLLLQQLIAKSDQNGLWTLQSGIFAENTSSIKLHEKCGFRLIGFREKIGQLNGVWKDNVIMERRSKIVGV
ncbi:MAG: GNAT family N-acetyltransferase [Chitinophagaceae bacterium]